MSYFLFHGLIYSGIVPDKNSPLRNVLLREIHEDPKLPGCIDIAHGWLRDCLENHPLCIASAASLPALPTRVIDVGNEEQDPRLVLSGHAVGKYVALSYRWGYKHSHSVMLTTKTLTKFQQGIPLSSLPKTLQDAVYVVRGLGISYLWIDALCIIQDSTEDWIVESGQMNTIYSNATLGLFATNAESAADGFLGKREIYNQYSISCAQLQPHNATDDNHTNNADLDNMVLRFDHPQHGIDNNYYCSLWADRGWTLQERLSPLRCLSYTELQMSWDCLTCKIGENGLRDYHDFSRQEDINEYIGGPYGSAGVTHLASRWNTITRLQDISLAHLTTLKLWYFILENFQRRFLSKESDRLPAIAAIAKVLDSRKAQTGRYLAGIWEGDLHNGLCWEVYPDLKHVPTYSFPNHEEQAIAVPSWSWASALNSYSPRYHFNLTGPARKLMTIQTPHIVNDEDRFIPRRPLFLRITAPCRLLSPSWHCKQTSTGTQEAHETVLERLLSEEHCQHGWVSEFFRKHQPWEGQHFLAMKAFEGRKCRPKEGMGSDVDYTLILVLESVKDEVGRYRRVGALGLETWRADIHGRMGRHYSLRTVLQMNLASPWTQMEIELV